MGQFKHTHKMLKICLILTTLTSVVFSTQLEDIADVRTGAAREPKLFFVSSSSTTSTVTTFSNCYSTLTSVTATCGRKRRAITEQIDVDVDVAPSMVSPDLDSGMEDPKSFSRKPRSSRASLNSPSSIPSPTYQWTNARCEYIMSYFLLMRSVKTREAATLLPIMQTFLAVLAITSPGTSLAGTSFRPILNPVGHHSTNEILLFCFSHWTVALASFDLMLPR